MPSPESAPSLIAGLKRRLAVHRRRMRYWSGVPSLTGFGPSGRSLMRGQMSANYESASEDAMAIAQVLERLGEKVEVVDVRETFRIRFASKNPRAPAVLIWPVRPQ